MDIFFKNISKQSHDLSSSQQHRKPKPDTVTPGPLEIEFDC